MDPNFVRAEFIQLGLPTHGRTAPQTRARSCYYTSLSHRNGYVDSW